MSKRSIALVRRLAAWSKKYPRQTIYPMTRNQEIDSELIEIEEEAKRLVGLFDV